jgi:hypothetical protein
MKPILTDNIFSSQNENVEKEHPLIHFSKRDNNGARF